MGGLGRRVRAGLAGADFAQKRQLVELLTDRVLVTDGQVEIRYVVPLSPDSERVRFCHLRKDYFDPVAPPVGLAVKARIACSVQDLSQPELEGAPKSLPDRAVLSSRGVTPDSRLGQQTDERAP